MLYGLQSLTDTTRSPLIDESGQFEKGWRRAESGGIPDIGALPAMGQVMIIIMITSESVEIRRPTGQSEMLLCNR